MAEEEGGEMNRQSFQASYDGRRENVHSIDAQLLGPALAAFGRLIRDANFQINGKKATVRVLVQSDFQHKCFNITFEVVQGVLSQVATFLTGDEVKNARAILEDLGIILGAQGLGLFGYLRWKRNRAVAEVKDSDEKGVIIIQIGDGNAAKVSRSAYELSKNPKIRTAVEGALKPLGIDGIEKIAFRDVDDGSPAMESIDQTEAATIVASFDIPEKPEDAPAPYA